MKRRVLSVLLTLCLLLAFAPAALAAEAEKSGTIGCVAWSLDGGTLTIGGSGAIPDFGKSGEASPNIDDRPWQQYRYAVKRLVVQSGITRVGSRAFQGFEKLESVTLADSVKSIGSWAFQNCCALESAAVPDGVALGSGTFAGAPAEPKLIAAGDSADGLRWTLSRAGTLTVSGTIPDYGKSGEASPNIDDRPWQQYRHAVRRLVVQNGVTHIGSRAFQGFEKLESIQLADSVKSVGIWAFQNCSALADVCLPDGAFLDTGAFRGTPFEGGSPAAPADTVRVTVNGKAVEWTDAVPFIDANGRTMAPLRAVGDALGLAVGWDDTAREASFTDGAKAIFFPIDSTEARAGLAGIIPMDTAAVVLNGRTYAPVRYLAVYFGYTVSWDSANATVVIEKP